MTVTQDGTRRERLRAQTLLEIKEHALAQVAEGGPEALSLNAVARAMRMSGPAIYRYFSSKDELLSVLVAEGWDELADSLQRAADAAQGDSPEVRLRAVAGAYRDWALAHPHRYRLVFASRYGSGVLSPERTIPAAHRNMAVLTEAVAALDPVAAGETVLAPELADQLQQWAQTRPGTADRPTATLQLSVLAWTRLHGLVSLEIEGAFAAMGIDPALLFAAELDHLVGRQPR